MIAEAVLTLLLAVFPRGMGADYVRVHREEIAHVAGDAATAHGVPVPVLVSVAWYESRVGADPAAYGGWGAPRDRLHRHEAGTADHAASALALGLRQCGSWSGAVAHFRSGLCRPWQPTHRQYVANVMHLVDRITPEPQS